MPKPTRADRELGLDVPIARRDFLNASLLGAGASLLGAPAPLRRLVRQLDDVAWDGYGGVGDYARSHGNMASVVRVAHEMRDGKYADASSRAVDTGERYELVIVGGGFSGLGAAYQCRKHGVGPCLILDNHPMFGGEAKRNEFLVKGRRLVGPQGSNDFLVPQRDGQGGWMMDVWHDLALPAALGDFRFQQWKPGVKPIAMPRDNYLFQFWNDQTPSHGFFFAQPDGAVRLVRDALGAGLAETPWPDSFKRDFVRWRTAHWHPYTGTELDRWLDGMTYESYIVDQLKLDRAIARYVDPILAAAIGLGSDVISALGARSVYMPGFQTENQITASYELAEGNAAAASFPGGNDGIMRQLVKWLIPDAIDGTKSFADVQNGKVRFDVLDRGGSPLRLRLGATVVSVEQRGNEVTVTYVRDGRLEKVRAKHAVMAGGGWSTQHIVADLPDSHRTAFQDMVRAPMLVVNVALNQWRFLYDQRLSAASWRGGFGFSCNIRQTIATRSDDPPLDPDAPAVLTFYVPFSEPGTPLRSQAAAGRTKLLGTSYADYERAVREQLASLFGRGGFDPRRDIAGVVLNRWGHAYVCPAPGFYHGRDGRPAPSDVIRQPVGRLAFANSELRGHQNAPGAIAEGRRAVDQLVGRS